MVIQSCACARYGPKNLENKRWMESRLGLFHICSTGCPSSCHYKSITPFSLSQQIRISCQMINSLVECFLDHLISYPELVPALFQFPWCEKYPYFPSYQIWKFRVIFCYLKNCSYQCSGRNDLWASASELSGLGQKSWNAITMAVLCWTSHWMRQKKRLFEKSGKGKFREDFLLDK